MSLWKYGVDQMLLEEMIQIDPQDEYWLGDDQCYLDYPSRFPVVTFELFATTGLCSIADRIRMKLGFKPMLEDDGDLDGWYNFTVSINGFSSTRLDSCIEFVVVNSDSEDNEQAYEIDMSDAEQALIYDLLDKQCLAYFGKGCNELLEEARVAMETDM